MRQEGSDRAPLALDSSERLPCLLSSHRNPRRREREWREEGEGGSHNDPLLFPLLSFCDVYLISVVIFFPLFQIVNSLPLFSSSKSGSSVTNWAPSFHVISSLVWQVGRSQGHRQCRTFFSSSASISPKEQAPKSNLAGIRLYETRAGKAFTAKKCSDSSRSPSITRCRHAPFLPP